MKNYPIVGREMLLYSHLFLFEHLPKAFIAGMLIEPSSTAGQNIVHLWIHCSYEVPIALREEEERLISFRALWMELIKSCYHLPLTNGTINCARFLLGSERWFFRGSLSCFQFSVHGMAGIRVWVWRERAPCQVKKYVKI